MAFGWPRNLAGALTRPGERRPREPRRPRSSGRSGPARTERVEIASIASGGEGVGRLPDGRAIFVHRTAPGETVEARVVTERPRWARGRLLKVLSPSPDRRQAPCRHYAECGGCTIEHLEYAAQLRAKGEIVAAALTRIGGLTLEPPEVVPSPSEFRYRNRVSFALRRGGSGEVVAGFHALHDPGRIVPIDGECLLPEPAISTVWDAIRGVWGRNAKLLPSGETLRLTLRATGSGRVSLLIEGGYSSGDPERLLATVPGLDAIWHRRVGSDAEHVAGAPGLPETWGEEEIELGGTAFLQVNRGAAARLEAWVTTLAGDLGGRAVVDAYCGVGLRARAMARAGATVTGIELDTSAIRIAESMPVPGARFVAASVEDALRDALPADLVVANPPRAGLDAVVIDTLLAQPPTRIIYVSCDPATLARDVSRLASAFDPGSIRCFDLFPQTAHVETVMELIRR